MPWISRAFFSVVALVAVGCLWSTVGCTRRGNNSPAPPTPTPQTNFYVNPTSGSDSNNGTQGAPFKTIAHALSVVAKSTASPLTVNLAVGTYSAASGEIFPLVIPNGITVSGQNLGYRNPLKGSFISGYGEDVNLEKLLGAGSKTHFTTMEVASGASASISGVYLGPHAALGYTTNYAAFDVIGTLSASHAFFGVGVASHIQSGILVPGGTLTCNACIVEGHEAIEAFSAGGSASGSSSGAPTLNLSGQSQQSVIGGDDTGILTDGTAKLTVSNQTFQSQKYAYRDILTAPTSYPSTSPSASPTAYPSATPTTGPYSSSVDFGSQGGSSGGNVFLGPAGSIVAEIYVATPGIQVTAEGNTWLPGQQCANASGQYERPFTIPTSRCRINGTLQPVGNGKNVTVKPGSDQASVMVGPILLPTPTPSPTASPTATPT